MSSKESPEHFTRASVRSIQDRWPTMIIKEGSQSYVGRGHLLVQRELDVTFKGRHGEEISLSLVSDEAGDTKITEATLRNPEGVHFATDADDSARLAVVALLHTAYAEATPELIAEVPARSVRWEDAGGTFVSLADSRGRFGSDALVTDALRALDKVTARRRVLTAEHLAEVARIYLEAVESGNRAPTVEVAERFGRPKPTAVTWVRAARKAGLIPPIEKRSR